MVIYFPVSHERRAVAATMAQDGAQSADFARAAPPGSAHRARRTDGCVAASCEGHSMSAVGRNCDGCGEPLPANLAPGPARRWCSERCRKTTLYSGTCVICGDPTNASQGRAQTDCLCRRCYVTTTRAHTRSRLLLEAERWRALTSRWPLANDWNRYANRGEHRALLERYHELTGPWPHPATVGQSFGSWAQFHGALGHEPCPGGRGTPKGARAAEMRELLARSTDEAGRATTDSEASRTRGPRVN